MNKLSLRNQRKTLKIISQLCNASKTGVIVQPENFTQSFPFLTPQLLEQMLCLLEAKQLIQIHRADFPDCFNINTLKITPQGLDFEPQISYDNKQKWIDRIWGFVTGALFTAAVELLMKKI